MHFLDKTGARLLSSASLQLLMIRRKLQAATAFLAAAQAIELAVLKLLAKADIPADIGL